jgi:hypothetical protein
MENLSELSTFRIRYPQFLGCYPQIWGESAFAAVFFLSKKTIY